jgi:serine/threonine protein kinase
MIRTEKNGRIYIHLSDFGLAKNLNPDYTRLNTLTGAINGTVEYLAPEILNARLVKPNISKQDVWSIGVIAYQLCSLRLPF